jgi:hypothetical protein
LRWNLTDLTAGEQVFFEWPGTDIFTLPEGVDASVAVPVAIRPHDLAGHQLSDGLAIDGFPVEPLLLETGVDLAFVLGVAPRQPSGAQPTSAYRVLLRAAEWNQYSETTLGLVDVETVNHRIRAWNEERAAAAQAIEQLALDEGETRRLIAGLEAVYGECGYAEKRKEVTVVPILPDAEIEMFFTDWRPARSRRLIELGFRDAQRVLADLGPLER